VAIHGDHYGIRSEKDLKTAMVEIPSMFDAGTTSIAIDASHLPDDQNLLANLAINPYIPKWAGYETEVGEIKGKEGLSTVEEALFLIRGLNAHGVFPDWIALNNGTTHGIEASDAGIQVQLTKDIHNALAKYKISGAQHGTSGNNSERLREIARQTRTTKANVATALQMITWGVQVNEFGNAYLDQKGEFVKVSNQGVTDEMWVEMVTYAKSKNLKAGDYKKLNLPFENKMMGLPREIRARMAKGVEDFVYELLTKVFNAQDTAPLAIEAILKAGSYDVGAKVERIENPADWTEQKIKERASNLHGDKGPKGNFDD
jgi:fructose/tagatose bisphosphate aldolase